MENLDFKCAQLGERIGRSVEEKILNDCLGVLEEQGVYAFFLYVMSKNQDENICKQCIEFLKKTPEDTPLIPTDEVTDPFLMLADLSIDLDKLLFARNLLLQALVYSRYHAKINSKKERK
ncbi:hypothetical protein [Methanosarcina siciliae]|uniref:hypothetical protein n=1 Tax=Methanosarcina siciliae TaxID=38027 RepID=UPI00064EEA25|nr:hypothetical protein [Methanosarcina siciliae]